MRAHRTLDHDRGGAPGYSEATEPLEARAKQLRVVGSLPGSLRPESLYKNEIDKLLARVRTRKHISLFANPQIHYENGPFFASADRSPMFKITGMSRKRHSMQPLKLFGQPPSAADLTFEYSNEMFPASKDIHRN